MTYEEAYMREKSFLDKEAVGNMKLPIDNYRLITPDGSVYGFTTKKRMRNFLFKHNCKRLR